jgi:hypothetical protein
MSPGQDRQRIVTELLDQYGTTYAEEAGITLRDKPSPLYRLLVLTTLLSVRISADIAVAAARECSHAGWRTPQRMRAASWQQRVDALGRAHYKRYDESTASYLGDSADFLLERWHGDLRRLRDDAGGDVGKVRELLTEFPRIGPTGADMFCREAQAVWPGLRPYFDDRARHAAQAAGLPHSSEALAELVPADQLARFAAALVRRSLA